MSDSLLLVSEYNLIWEALLHYEKHLENKSSNANDEHEQLRHAEKLQDLVSTKKTVQHKALSAYGLELSDSDFTKSDQQK